MNNVWIGIDTSNYTTSVSAVSTDGSFYNIKIPLCVKANEKGVRQSDAVFMHIKNLPDAMSDLSSSLRKDIGEFRIAAIGVSSRPRAVEGSYMPCFLSGIAVASSLSSTLSVPLYEYSHQEGHIRAALFGSNSDVPELFYSFHLSGGTCELLEVQRTEFGFFEQVVADSADITLGQLVDRTGVMLGIDFPCGSELEKLASASSEKFKIKICGNERINLSGFENKAVKMLEDGRAPEDIASFVYAVIISSVEKMLSFRKNKALPVIFAGGVSGSEILQSRVCGLCDARFAPPSLSSDNAVGIALLTKERYIKGV